MKYALYTISIVTAIALQSCTPEPLDIELDTVEPKLVVSSQVIPNQVMIVTLSKSFSALAFSEEEEGDSVPTDLLNQILVSNATVTITYLGITDTLYGIPTVPGLYVSLQTPQFDHVEYTLEAFDPATGMSISSTASMLPFVGFDTVSTSSGTTSNLDWVDVHYEFTDPPNEDNWYMVNYYLQTNDSLQVGSPFTSGNEIPTVTQLLSDQFFENSVYSDTYRLYDLDSDTILVSVSNISKEYFDFLTLRERSTNFFTDLSKEPLNYPTNIDGGYGFFTTHHPDIEVEIID
jgi:hypothetical protein